MGKLGLEHNKFKNYVEKNFYKIVIALSIPMMIQNLLSSCLGIVDTLMIGRIGESEIAASGIANQYLFSVRKELIKSYFKQVVPILLNDSLWGLATSAFTAAYCTLGTDAMVSI